MALYSSVYIIPYVFFFFIVFVFSFPAQYARTNIGYSWNLWRYYSLPLLFLFFLGFRGFIGSDWIGYYHFYEKAPSLLSGSDCIKDFFLKSKWNDWDKGFILFAVLLKTVSANYAFFQFVNFLIEFLIFWHVFREYSLKKYIGLFLCFYFVFGGGMRISLNTMRNAKSIAVFMLSLRYISEKSFFKYFVLNFFGFFFHSSAIFYIPLYFVLNKKIPRKIILAFFILGTGFFLLRIHWATTIVELIVPYLPGRLPRIILFYLATQADSTAYGITIGYLERSLSFLLVFCLSNKLVKKNKKNIPVLNCFYIYCFIYLYLSELGIFLERVPLLFIFSYWIIYPQIYEILSKEKKYLFLLLFFFYSMMKMINYMAFTYQYDNLLSINYKTYEVRKTLFEQNFDKINGD